MTTSTLAAVDAEARRAGKAVAALAGAGVLAVMSGPATLDQGAAPGLILLCLTGLAIFSLTPSSWVANPGRRADVRLLQATAVLLFGAVLAAFVAVPVTVLFALGATATMLGSTLLGKVR